MDTIFTYAQDTGAGGSSVSSIAYIAMIVGLWKMFEKAGEPGWHALIPIYNMYRLVMITMGSSTWFVYYLLSCFALIFPLIGFIPFLYVNYIIGKATAKSFGRPDGWAWGYLFLSAVFYCLTGFGDADYYGIMGSGDTRTDQARGAKTVDFDVVRNGGTVNSEPVNVEPVNAEPVYSGPDYSEPEYSEPIDVDPEVTPAAPSESEVEFSFDRADE